MSDAVPVSGRVEARFGAVRAAFRHNLDSGEDLGAAFTVIRDGEILVDLIGGYEDRKRETLWSEQTIACVYSSGKAVMSALIAKAVSDGLLDYDRPVADVWPDFAAGGKEAITLAQALSHQGGLCGFPDEMNPADWLDWDAICSRLAAMAPLWAPGSASGYHPQTVGFIGGEVLRRVNGKSVGALIADAPHAQGLQLFCGMRADQMARAAYMPKPPKAPDLGEINEVTKLAFLKPWSAPAKVAREDWMAAELPASNMHGDARALATFVHPFAIGGAGMNGDPFIDPAVVEAALKVRSEGPDLVLPFTLCWAAGLMKNTQGHFGPSASAYGHAGFGGSCVVVDPDRRVSMAYVMNKMSPHLVGDPRALRLIDAVYDCL
ncbi:MAG: serine hydrolase domain-containing protein [Pseudomonadota bacterium]